MSLKGSFCDEVVIILMYKDYLNMVKDKLQRDVLKKSFVDGVLEIGICFNLKEDSNFVPGIKTKKIVINIQNSFFIPQQLRGKSCIVKYNKLIYNYLLRN